MLSEMPEIPRVSVLNYKPAQGKTRAIIERQPLAAQGILVAHRGSVRADGREEETEGQSLPPGQRIGAALRGRRHLN
ncbi:hypothetical protein [uncultured Bilophila sp.]|uniref:hypothetical protein n=1 Tax=uncultured Bilophila sp. TaxID=529385 RepID=UPI00280B32F6|nr:hypothetical protein [uncultured Bilophila sp.]